MIPLVGTSRELEKLRSTYVDALIPLVDEDGRVRGRFNQMAAATGRLSQEQPNLQNIPVRSEEGRTIRKAFVADEGSVFLVADYSQVELRILAHFSGDEPLVRAFNEGIDVHKQTAAVVFDIPLDRVTSEQRGQAKTINFATLYGQGAFSLARQLGVGREDAKTFIDQYFERFSGVRAYLDGQVALAREAGIEIGATGAIATDPRCETSSPSLASAFRILLTIGTGRSVI